MIYKSLEPRSRLSYCVQRKISVINAESVSYYIRFSQFLVHSFMNPLDAEKWIARCSFLRHAVDEAVSHPVWVLRYQMRIQWNFQVSELLFHASNF